MQFRSQSPTETHAIASALGAALTPEGGVVSLSGPLGAGKTLFVKGLAAALGLDERHVASPTFVIAGEYPLATGGGLARLVHVDFYRVESLAELENAGLEDWLAEGTLLVVEWGERFPEALPEDRLDVSIRGGELPASRILTASARGPWSRGLAERWSSRWR